ncbi:MAG TPA: T9SS type A sorting domain-containing protein [Bacteroidia bacterium]|nr:T9SS type A sorting domain-containing protein [Bacteroidia bacterium]
MKTILIVLILNLFIQFFSFSQTAPPIQWQNTIGGSLGDAMSTVFKTFEGGYILGGGSNSTISGDKTDSSRGLLDFWIVKVNSIGLIEWQKTIGGSNYDMLYSLQQTTDNGYILGGTSDSGISGDKTDSSRGTSDYWILKLDSVGNILWQKTFGGSSGDNLFALQQTTDGGFILGGESLSGISGDKTDFCRGGFDYWIIKIDSVGNIIWQKTIGGSDFDELYSIKQTGDGGYILGGASLSNISFEKTENCRGALDFWAVKIDSLGTIQWQKTMGGNDFETLFSIQQTTDGGYILGGDSFSNISGDKTENSRGGDDFWLVKLDPNGNYLWQKTIGGNMNEWINSVIQTTDNGYLMLGNSGSDISGEKTDFCRGLSDIWVVKTDSLANIQWQKTIGGTDIDGASSVSQTLDDGFILGGTSSSNIGFEKTENSMGESDYWLIKHDAITGIAGEERIVNNKLIIYANPTAGKCNISVPDDFVHEKNLTLNIYDNTGKLIQQKLLQMNDGKIKLNLETEARGIYTVTLSSKKKSYYGKIVFE